ncbi:MAG: hypothetical protein ACRCXT_00065 [Paraclostridium sp.]
MGTLAGRAFFQNPSTFQNGPSNNKTFIYQGVQFYLAPVLNTIAGKAATEVAGAIVMHRSAYAQLPINETTLTEVDQVILDIRYAGLSYDSVGVVTDSNRIITFEFTLPAGRTISKGVNA